MISRGRILVEDGKLVTKGGGEFVQRARTADLLR